MEEKEYVDKMSLEIALEVAYKFAYGMGLFASVNKDVVSKVCELLLNELQAYKDKEDKLREYCKTVKRTGRVFENWKDTVDYQIKVANDILQIIDKEVE